jgi:hypothetical protein
MIVVGIAGTWAWKSAWWQDDSPFWRYMRRHGIYPARVNGRPFRWSTDLGSTWQFWKSRHSDWEAGGDALAYYLDALPPAYRVVVAHSHGGQVAAYCAAQGVTIDRLVTVATPVRADMEGTWKLARQSIRHWCHVMDSEGDKTAWWGAFGDGRFGNTREFKDTDATVKIGGIGHSGLLSDPSKFPMWEYTGLIGQLKET